MIALHKSRLLESAGFPFHGFTERGGGASKPPFDSLNLAHEVGDDPESVKENLRRLKRFLDTDDPLFRVRQVHGDKVVCISERTAASDLSWTASPTVEADGMVGDGAFQVLAIQSADCAAVLLADPRTGAVGALHAGWRGTAKGIVRNGVRAMVERGADPARIVAAVGPCICLRCYEVGPEVARHFPESCDPSESGQGRFHCDLGLAVEVSLLAAGLTGKHIERIAACTACGSDALFSYRGAGGVTGRGLGFIANREDRGGSGTEPRR